MRHSNRTAALILAVCAYVPILLTEPGRVSADTKTYLTLDPSAVLRQATSMWDPSVGAGTVPHQNIGYLFPLGPYYWVMEAIGSPDWITQRLLWGTLVFAAAYGMFRLARWLGWSASGALVAAFAYGFSPYLLSYVARLSVILGPWAALPWMVLLVAKAARTRSWKPAAQFALVVALVGSVNATALVLAGLGPVIWLVTDVLSGRVRVGAAVRAAAKIGVLSAAVSVWWIVALRIQGNYGLPILRYTETYEAVGGSSTPAEIMRGLGYWFFYGGDRLDPWVGPAAPYSDSVVVMALGFTIAGLGLLGFLTRFSGRASATMLLLIGLAVSAGAAPLGNSTPYGALFRWFASDTTAGMALRSTPRAAPLVILALAFGLGASSEWLRSWIAERSLSREAGIRWGVVVSAGAIGLVVLQLFPWFTAASMSSSIERDETLPAYETELATWLDANRNPDGTGRVWEIPASDFANYRWGGTVDPVLPGIIDRPYLARELVPQGGAATADLLNAFERRLPEGWFEPETLPRIASAFGIDTIVVRNDLQHERYRLARPGPLWSDLQSVLGEPDFAGPIVTDDTVIPLVDERTLAHRDVANSFPVVAAWDLEPSPLVSASPADSPIVLAGNGEGLVDLAGADLFDPTRTVLYASTLHDLVTTGEFDPAMVGPDSWWVVTDTNRKQARHWSTISSNLGALETAGPVSMETDPNDQQLDVFLPGDESTLARQTIAVHEGEVADVRASYYGNRIAFTPGDAPSFAIDGDPTTEWRAGAFGPTGGIRWEADLVQPVQAASITVLQPITDATNRYIIDARITLDAGLPTETSFDVVLDERSRAEPGQPIDLPGDSFESIRIEVVDDNIGKSADYTTLPGVGLAEVTIPGVTDDLVVRVPSLDAFGIVDADAIADQRITYLFTRQRIDQATPNESPAEPTLVRAFDVIDARPFTIGGDVRLSSAASEETLGAIFEDPYSVFADRRLKGSPESRGAAAVDGDLTTAWQTGFREVAGATLTIDHPEPITTDAMTLSWLDDGRHSIPTEVTITGDDGVARTLPIPATEPVDGVATAVLALDGYTASRSTITFSGVDERTTPEYFSRLPEVLPLGIAEIQLGDPPAPTDPNLPIDDTCRSDLLTIDDVAVPVRIVGSRQEAASRSEMSWEACGAPIELAVGVHRLRAVPGALSGFDLDRAVLDGAGAVPRPQRSSPPVTTSDATDDTKIHVTVNASDAPTWLVLEQSWNAGWTAHSNGVDLGAPVLVDGYANGWLLAPSGDRSIVLEWTPQRNMVRALWFSLIAGLVMIGILVWTRRDRLSASIAEVDEDDGWAGWSRSSPIVALGLIGLVTFLAGPIVGAGALVALLTRRRLPWIPLLTVLVAGSVVAGLVIASEWRYDYPAGPDWPSRFGWTSPLVWMAVATVSMAALMPDGIRRKR